MNGSETYVTLFDKAIQELVRDGLRISVRQPRMAAFLLRTLRNQKRASRIRARQDAEGVHVPALMITSITRRCNLNCKGCYARAQHRDAEPELTPAELCRVLDEAAELGVSIALIAGGEPLTRPEILDMAADRPEMLFPLFTNGLLLDEALIDRLARLRNVIPVLSLEGHQADTDARRGRGVHGHLLETMRKLDERGIFFGTSITLTSQNYDTVSDPTYLQDLIATGCRIFFFVEYVPVQPGTEFLVLTDAQRTALPRLLETFREQLPGLFVALPGDEEQFGGCLAAGRGFIHVSPEGRLEPCPFAPFSDVSLKNTPLREALQSPFMRAIRESDIHLSETEGGCALWAQRDWVNGLLQDRPVIETASVAA